jgi:hypothetical protein
MKKLLFGIIIITLPLIVFFQYKDFKRFNPPTSYEYVVNENLDLNYHNYALVEEYFAKVVEISAYARKQWRNEGVDVRFPDQYSQTELNIAKYYNELLSRVQWLEAKLLESKQWKVKGYSNDDIQKIESGISPEMIKWLTEKEQLINTVLGDTGEYVWILQKQLVSKGFDHPFDGVFGSETKNALISFQEKNNLYPSGQMSERTFKALFLK